MKGYRHGRGTAQRKLDANLPSPRDVVGRFRCSYCFDRVAREETEEAIGSNFKLMQYQ